MNPYNAQYPILNSRFTNNPHALGELSLVACPICATLQNIDGPTVCENCKAVLIPEPTDLADLDLASEVSALPLAEYAEDSALVVMVRRAQGLELAAYQIQSHEAWLETTGSLMREALLSMPDTPVSLRMLSGNYPALASATLSGTLARETIPVLLGDPLVDVRRSLYLIGWDEEREQPVTQDTAWVEVTAPPRMLMGLLEQGASPVLYNPIAPSSSRLMPLFS